MIIVHKVKTSNKHPNADSLMVYEMTNGGSILTIVANLTNVYEINDHVLVALPGSILKEDNLEIRQTKIRGVHSTGMALGKTNLPVGFDVSEQYCTEMPKIEGHQLSPWVDIELLYNIRKNLKAMNDVKKVAYRFKTKIHGTSAGIQIHPDGTLICQSRNKILTEQWDNVGFFKWVMEKQDYWKSLKSDIPIIIFGEFAGKGINSGCSIHQVEKKIFCIFAIEYQNENGKILDTGPSSIEFKVKPNKEDIFVLPFMDEECTLDYTDPEILKEQAEKLNTLCDKVEKCDPFVIETFGISGTGEGFVAYPVINNSYMINKLDFSELVFKCKGSLHKVINNKKSVQINPEIIKSFEDFSNLFLTDNRLNQIIGNILNFSKKDTGIFIQSVLNDVKKESVLELEESNLLWNDDLKTYLSSNIRKWFLNKCEI